MDELFFLQVVGAVIIGNALTALWVYGAWRIKDFEKRMGYKGIGGFYPLRLLWMLLPAPGFVGIAAILF